MRSRFQSGVLVLSIICLTVIPLVSANGSVFRYSVSSGDCIYYQWTGNKTQDSYTVNLDHIIYTEFAFGAPDNVTIPYVLEHYLLFFENGTGIGYNSPGNPCSIKPGIELVEPYDTFLAPLPIGNWTFTTLTYQDIFNITEDFSTWTLSYTYRWNVDSIKQRQITYSKTDGIVNHLAVYQYLSANSSYYYELERITDDFPILIIGTAAFSCLLIAIVIVYRRRRM